MKPNANKVPRHIGIVLDGNRRFAKKLMMKPWMGHAWGAKKVEALLNWCHELGVKELTLYAFSVDNFNRPREEFDYLMALFKKEFKKISRDTRLEKYKIRINFIGRLYMFPKDIQKVMQSLMEKTKNNRRHIVNLAMAYGGRQEIIDAVRKISEAVKKGKISIDKINEDVFAKNLYMKDEPELVIRTGGEKRTSNFLIWQANYSEWIFLEKSWPEFEKKDLIECINEYSKRERRFGN